MKSKLKMILTPLLRKKKIEFIWLIMKYVKAPDDNQFFKKPLIDLVGEARELLANRLKIIRTDNSFANEGAVIQENFEQLKIEKGFLVDIGAADGIRQSSTNRFLRTNNWSGLLIECDSESFTKLSFLYNDRDDLSLAKTKVSPTNIVSLLKGYEVPWNFEYLNIDIDSYDLEVLRRIITSDYRPRLISMEVNEKFPPNVDFEVIFDQEHAWQGDHFFGCSISSATKCLNKLGYRLSTMEYNNAIFVDQGNAVIDQSVELWDFYDQGYWNKQDREILFPWNQDVNHFYRLDPRILEADILKRFSMYTGKYLLTVNDL
jgi:hypothetical protein